MSRQGPPELRHALSFPALAVMRSNLLVQPLVASLRAKGRTPMQIIVAVMRKLLHQAFGLFKYGTDFNPHYQPVKGGITP